MNQISSADFEVLLRRVGLSLSPAQITHMLKAWELVEPMLERIRSYEGDRSAEPAHIFRANAYFVELTEAKTDADSDNS